MIDTASSKYNRLDYSLYTHFMYAVYSRKEHEVCTLIRVYIDVRMCRIGVLQGTKYVF